MRVFPLFLLALIISCGNKSVERITKLYLAEDANAFEAKAKELGLNFSGDTIYEVTGEKSLLVKLDRFIADQGSSINLNSIKVIKPTSFKVKADLLYMAKKDFNLPSFLKKYPSYDGRGVKVGVIDDGISPSQKAFQTTSDGKRKFLKRSSNSSFYHISLSAGLNNSYTKSVATAYAGKDLLEGVFSEEEKSYDLNGKQKEDEEAKDKIEIVVVKGDKALVCIDKNVDQKRQDNECFGLFGTTGEFSYWDEEQTKSFLVDWVEEDKTIAISETEAKRDSHGEGVASVMSAHMLGGKFSGVAPGSQILDYDLSEKGVGVENYYTINTFIKAFEWLGQNGADVANVSYSLFFTSIKAQEFMQKAIAKMVNKYNMVISFSAGNNGPGLGSLNRRSIYPNSVMVAGAYVSKELDENVHGVTGLPDEGRVVWYSSRGPGPTDAFGPVMISPLSSLTYSDQGSGYRAFSGTSSAAPALAGIATVLISAVKQRKLPVDAKTIVHALRASAKRLKAEPFISQGYGLPQIDKALKIYKDMINGKRFLELESKIHHRTSDEGTTKRGLLLKASESPDQYDFRAVLKGSVSKLAPYGTARELLETLRVEYSHDWISGPQNFWASVSEARFHIAVDVKKAIANGEAESFGEVRFYNSVTGELYHILPITIINDIMLLNKKEKFEISLSSHEGKRLHFYVPENVNGIKIRTDVLQGNPGFRYMLVYGPNRVKNFLSLDESQFVNTEKAGWYQVTFVTHGGSLLDAKIAVEVEPIKIKLPVKRLTVAKDKGLDLRVVNLGKAVGAKILLEKAPELVASEYVAASEDNASLILTRNISTKGLYELKTSSLNDFETNYVYMGCDYIVKSKDGTQKYFEGRSYDKTTDEEEEVTFTCQSFDYNYTAANYVLELFKSSTQVGSSSEYVLLKTGHNKVSLSHIEEGDFEVSLASPFVNNSQEISLGKITIVFGDEEDKIE